MKKRPGRRAKGAVCWNRASTSRSYWLSVDVGSFLAFDSVVLKLLQPSETVRCIDPGRRQVKRLTSGCSERKEWRRRIRWPLRAPALGPTLFARSSTSTTGLGGAASGASCPWARSAGSLRSFTSVLLSRHLVGGATSEFLISMNDPIWAGKYSGKTIEHVLLTKTDYINWALKQKKPSGWLIEFIACARELIKIFDSKPYKCSCFGLNCLQAPTRVSIHQGSLGLMAWCDSCSPRLAGVDLSTISVLRKLSDAFVYVESQCPKPRTNYTKVMRRRASRGLRMASSRLGRLKRSSTERA